jgi:hypothetical protein
MNESEIGPFRAAWRRFQQRGDKVFATGGIIKNVPLVEEGGTGCFPSAGTPDGLYDLVIESFGQPLPTDLPEKP